MTRMGGSGRWWPWSLTIVLGLTVAGNAWLWRVANSDPSFAVEPDYYQQAIHWDSTTARSRRSAALGWSVDASLTAVANGTQLRVTVRDPDGQPMQDVRLSANARHTARAAIIYPLVFTPTIDSGFLGTVPSTRSGRWEVRLSAVRATDHYVATLRLESVPPPDR